MVIDDRVSVHKLVHNVFFDHEVVSALEGTEAQFKMQTALSEFDAVICDYDFGRMDPRKGDEIIHHLQHLFPDNKIIWVLFTGSPPYPPLPEECAITVTKDNVEMLRRVVLGSGG